MQRRKFLHTALTGATALSTTALAPSSAWASRQPDTWQASFHNALDEQPWLVGYATAAQESYSGAA
ncbi:MAG: hypothetical protein ACI9UU_003695 [Candidatus Azotimanducaceae bacterium]|jgi:hypothetical protein